MMFLILEYQLKKGWLSGWCHWWRLMSYVVVSMRGWRLKKLKYVIEGVEGMLCPQI